MGFEIDEDLFAYLEHYARRKLEVANKSAAGSYAESAMTSEGFEVTDEDIPF